ncbi:MULTISPECIES: alpha/beta hydrolase family protein [Legionella]|uniref:Alpha/beta fold hydrolase n=1 Tax=Legionella resiliens TaxID=2905958 RepID=A0ABS8WYJ5_9GAMM|nr:MULTISPECIES: alpha/beta fold hydrolase [unclassified Legionella]MCE0721640.1 alpha/beta fold hydrolase [Legionella sp. 9fVS26]MCE3530794.1 alpha/beta fold hydrolase [Legionella sp. 8cVS16]QLZ70356.1 dipeptidyl aminopeptidase [Legionella sp. PC1000]
MQDIIKPALFNAQLIRSLGCTTYQGAEIGECLAIANQIEPGDKDSWYTRWAAFADSNYRIAESCRSQGLHIDAKLAFLRACTYYRTAFFFLEDKPTDPRIEQALQYSIRAFHQALEFFETPVEKLEIPFENTTLPGYLYLHHSVSNHPKPILIDTGGGDSTKEELYFSTAAEALKRGFHCLNFEGPGQGSMLRLNKIPFIPDWERVIEKVVDFIIDRPEIDTNKIFLIGRSFGGYLAARAVTKEKRIAGCIVDPGIFDASGNLEAKFNSFMTKFPDLKEVPFEKALTHLMNTDENLQFMLESRKWRFGAKTIEEMLHRTRAYTLNGLVEKIQCPMLICDNTLEYITLGQAKKLYDQLQCKKQYILFNDEEGTGGHCEPLAPRLFSAKIYAWLSSL